MDKFRKQTIDADIDKQLSVEECLSKCKNEADKKHMKMLEEVEKKFEQIIIMMDAASLKKNVLSFFIKKLKYFKSKWDFYQRKKIIEIYSSRAYWVGDSRLN